MSKEYAYAQNAYVAHLHAWHALTKQDFHARSDAIETAGACRAWMLLYQQRAPAHEQPSINPYIRGLDMVLFLLNTGEPCEERIRICHQNIERFFTLSKT